MGENILILAFVVIIIGGIGSIRGAFVASIFVGLVDTVGRAFLPELFKLVMSPAAASAAAPALSSMLIYLLMAVVLVRAAGGPVPGARPMTALATVRNDRDGHCCSPCWRCCRSTATRRATSS